MVKIAIVGRPNVGKSTLFNRLAGRRLAIVDDRPGVTRDRRFATGRLGDLDLDLIDTAGFEDVTDESLEARMRRQTELALEEADIALFIVDAREGVTPDDRVFAEILRKQGKPVILAANKAEGHAGEAGALEAFDLGLGEPIPISAEHNEGMSDLYAAVSEHAELLAETENEDDDSEKPIRIAIVGRPNAGKSTLVNALIGEDRMLTGPEAGITRDAIPVDWVWDDKRIRLVDTAGMRRKAKVEQKLERLSVQDTIRAITFAEVVVLVMDATHPFETQDLQIADLVEREGRALIFVLAKFDLMEDPGAALREANEVALKMLPQVKGTPLVALSAQTGRHLDRLMPAVVKAHADWSSKLRTRDLNDWLALAVEKHPPPAVNGRRMKAKYMAQTKARPPTFVIIATRSDQAPDAYKRYLVNSLRESFDLPGTPIRLNIRANSKNPYDDDGKEAKPAPRPVQAAKIKAAREAEKADRLAGRPVLSKGKKASATARAARAANLTKREKRARPVSKKPTTGKPGTRRPPPKNR